MNNQNENTSTYTKNKDEAEAVEGEIMLKCSLCGKKLFANESSDIIIEEVAGVQYHFDNPQCVVMFKRLSSVYGEGFELDALCSLENCLLIK